MDIMEAPEATNGLTTGEALTKDGASELHDSIFQNGFVSDGTAELSKINGNHSDILDGDLASQGESLKPTIHGHEGSLNNHVEENPEVSKDQLKVEEDMDNSTATSNLSDISPYEDSEKSMDIGEGEQSMNIGEGEKSMDIGEGEQSMNIGEGTINHDKESEKQNNCETEKENNKKLSNVISQEDDKSSMDVGEDSNEKDEEIEKTDGYDTGTATSKNIVNDGKQEGDVIDSEYIRKEGNTENKTNDGKKIENVDEAVESGNNCDNKLDDMYSEDKSNCTNKSCSVDNSMYNDNNTPEKMEINECKKYQASANSESNIEEKSREKSDHSDDDDDDDKKMVNEINETDCQNNKSKTDHVAVDDENQSGLKSVEKVTDIDGIEILITINEEIEESDNEENSAKKEKDEKIEKNKAEKLNEDNASDTDKKDMQAVVTVEDSPQKPPDIAPKVIPPTSVVNLKIGTTIPGQAPMTTGPIRFPLMPASLVQYGLTPQPTTQQKYINVGGQQILITVPSSSMGPALNTGSSFIAASPLMNVNMVAATFPPPNPNKNPLDKTVDIDLPQASWEQKELIKYEVMSRKPDNAFWGGLANLNKKAELSSVAKFLFDLGSDIVKESAYEQIVLVQKKKEDAAQLNDTEKESLRRMKKVVEELKNKLKYLHDLPEKKCECGFTTDSANVMFLHKQYPHSPAVLDKTYSLDCAHCSENFQGKFAEDVYKAHLAKEHNAVAKFMIKPSFWSCNLCPFEGTNKNTLIKHQVKCQKSFKQHLNLAPHHVDINLSLKNIFYKYQVNNKKIQQAQIAAVERPDTRSNSLQNTQKSVIQNKQVIQPKPKPRPPVVINPNRPIIPAQFQPAPITGISAANSWQNNYSRILQTAANVSIEGSQYAQIQRPPPPLRPSTVNKPTVNQLLKTQQGSSVTNRTGFEVCEICGGYVKDRMSLRIHFFYAHKIEMPAHVFSKPLAPLFCSSCNERFWTSQGFAKHKTSVKHLHNMKKMESISNQCWICHQKPENLYSHLHKFHRLTTGECMALKRCMFCGIQSHTRKELELHMAATHGVLIKGDDKSDVNAQSQPSTQTKPVAPTNVSTKNLSTVVTGGTSGMVRNNFCVFCSAQFPDNTKLTLHCLSVHATCKKCGMVVNKSADLARHVCKLSSKTCSICGLKNLKPAGLVKHLETHVKPCKVVLKRLNTFQIHLSTENKNRRDSRESSARDARLRSRSELTSSECSINDGKTNTNEKKSLTVALKFDKGKGKNKESKFSIVLDKKGNSKDEVVIESDHDSDVIIEEEEKTEIILDSDIDEDKLESHNKKEKETEENQNESKKDISKSESENVQEAFKSGKNSDKSESDDKVDKLEKECKVESAESENIKDGDDQSIDSETSDNLNKHGKINENERQEFVDPDATNESSKNEKEEVGQHESRTSNIPMETVSPVDTSRKSRKRSHSDIENASDSAEETKRKKTDDDSDSS